jgi:threonine-phosphate decarboxylase
MMKESHGGNIYLLAERLGIREDEVIDFSASINPLGVPGSVQSALCENMKCLFNYPDPDAGRLRRKIAGHTGLSPDSIICGNGSTELIYLVVRALRPASVLIPVPTFSEYERAVRCEGSGVRGEEPKIGYFPLKREGNFDLVPDAFISAMGCDVNSSLLTPHSSRPFQSGAPHDSRFTIHASRPFQMAFLCNPNNPTGRLIKREDMIAIADAARALKCVLVVDEAFIDFCPGASIADEVMKNPYLIVLRSLTKIYALSGLRVGYAVFPPSLIDAVKDAKEPWTVNTLAQIAGVAALDDDAYLTKSLGLVKREKKAVEEGFMQMGISFFSSAVNYYLVQMEKAQEMASNLKQKGILVRNCSNFVGLDSSYIRVAVKSASDNMRLRREISSWQA